MKTDAIVSSAPQTSLSKLLPSASNTPPETIFFVDRNLGRGFAAALRDAGLRAEWHDEYFPQDMPDEQWLAGVAARGWVVVTHDAMMRHTSKIRDTIVETQASVFLIVAKNLNGGQYSALFLSSLPRILRFINKQTPPYIAKLKRDPHDLGKPGTVELWFPKSSAE